MVIVSMFSELEGEVLHTNWIFWRCFRTNGCHLNDDADY